MTSEQILGFFSHHKIEVKNCGNILSHEYIGINDEVVLDIVRHKLPKLKIQIGKIILLENKSNKVFM